MSAMGYFQVKFWFTSSGFIFQGAINGLLYILFYKCITLIKYYMNIKVKRFNLLF